MESRTWPCMLSGLEIGTSSRVQVPAVGRFPRRNFVPPVMRFSPQYTTAVRLGVRSVTLISRVVEQGSISTYSTILPLPNLRNSSRSAICTVLVPAPLCTNDCDPVAYCEVSHVTLPTGTVAPEGR